MKFLGPFFNEFVRLVYKRKKTLKMFTADGQTDKPNIEFSALKNVLPHIIVIKRRIILIKSTQNPRNRINISTNLTFQKSNKIYQINKISIIFMRKLNDILLSFQELLETEKDPQTTILAARKVLKKTNFPRKE